MTQKIYYFIPFILLALIIITVLIYKTQKKYSERQRPAQFTRDQNTYIGYVILKNKTRRFISTNPKGYNITISDSDIELIHETNVYLIDKDPSKKGRWLYFAELQFYVSKDVT